MQLSLVIPLIVSAFVIPILAYFLYRYHLARKARLLLTAGELFDKDCSRFDILEEGKEYPTTIPMSTSL